MRLYRLLLLIGILVLSGRQASQAQFATWSRPLSPATSAATSVTDAAGNTYVAGSYSAALTMGATTLPATTTPADRHNAFVAKIDPQGLVEWALAGISARADDVLALALDPNGGVNVVFYAGVDSTGGGTNFNYSYAFGGRTLSQGGTMLARVSSTGTVGYLGYLHLGVSMAFVSSLAVDAAGNAFVAVNSNGGRTFGPYTFPSPAMGQTYSAALFKVSPTGTVSLLQALVPTANNTFNYSTLTVQDVQVGTAGDLYCTGSLEGNATLGTSPAVALATAPNSGGAFLVRYSAAGVAQWGLINTYTGSGNMNYAAGVRVAVAPTGEVYMAGGTSNSSYAFGGLSSTTPGGFLLKTSAAGAPLWLRAAHTSTYSDTYAFATRLVLDAAGNVYRLGTFDRTAVAFGNNITLNHPLPASQPQQYNTTWYLVSYDAAGTTRWARSVESTTPPASNYVHSSGLGVDSNGHLYLLNRRTVSNSSQISVNGFPLDPGYTLLRLSPAGRVAGTIYIDQNNNGVRDAGELPFPYPQIVTDQGQNQAYSSAAGTGEYSFFGLAGTSFGLSLPSPHPYYTVGAPTLRTGTYPGVGLTATGQDFGLVPQANRTDVRVTFTAVGAARPGFSGRYRVTLENVGTTLASGSASFTLDSRVTYSGSLPAGSAAGQTVTWTYSNLAPFAQLNYDVTYDLPTTIALGAQLTGLAAAPLAGDVNPADNSHSGVNVVTGAYDPNDITVNYSRLTPAQVAAGQALDYTIRFQNLGTDTAFTVIVQDALNAGQLSLGSLELVAQSHNCVWSLSGRGLLTVRFPSIKLPHRAVNALGSQGFVRFRVRPRPTLALGDVVPNEANIFFDYNAPVRTNTATTAVMNLTGLLNQRPAATWTAYPNPASEAVSMAAELPAAGTVRLELSDALGRPVRQHALSAPAGPLRCTLDVRGLAAGFYALRLTLPGGQISSRTIVVQP